jgi:hypothetical protein
VLGQSFARHKILGRYRHLNHAFAAARGVPARRRR